MAEIHGFNWTYDTIVNDILTKCSVSLPYTPKNGEKFTPNLLETTGLWDTGATNSVITKELVQKLGLAPTGVVQTHHAGGTSTVNSYLINIYLPNFLAMSYIRVTECDETIGRFGLLIGMDVINRGDFAISNFGGRTTFSFRMPSIYMIDLAKDCVPDKTINKTNSTIDAKTPRNNPCPCGSKKKFKHCHGKN